jgi:trk system potassium uptake protein TrkA
MYIVIVGADDIGRPLVEMATMGGNEVVVVERDRARAEAADAAFDCLVLNADATVKSTLEDAGAARADALVSTTDRDATNVMVCLLGQELDVPTIVSVVHDPDHMGLFRRLGVTTIENPQRLIAEQLYRSVTRPSIVDFMRIGEDAEVFEITVGADAPIAGRTIREAVASGLLDGDEMLIVAVERDGGADPITPRGDTRITPGDVLTVYSVDGATAAVTDVFGHFEDHD